jgi:hypothetical protein
MTRVGQRILLGEVAREGGVAVPLVLSGFIGKPLRRRLAEITWELPRNFQMGDVPTKAVVRFSQWPSSIQFSAAQSKRLSVQLVSE